MEQALSSKFKRECVSLGREIVTVTLTLFKIMVPVLIIIRILESLGLIKYLSWLLAPVMSLVGLPESMGLVWATTLVTNIYGGMIIFFQAADTASLSVAQVTVIGGMMLIAHALPIEAAIAQKAGVRLPFTLALRVGGAIVYGACLHLIYSATDTLQGPHTMTWIPEQVDTSWSAWFLTQGKNLFLIFVIISALITFLRILKLLHIERLLHYLLKPVLKFLGIGEQATNITIIGMILGLSFGGGLLIHEANNGKVSPKDVFTSISLLSVCHSLIEDTLLILLLGADITGVLWFRLVFGVLIIGVSFRWLHKLPESTKHRYLYDTKRHTT